MMLLWISSVFALRFFLGLLAAGLAHAGWRWSTGAALSKSYVKKGAFSALHRRLPAKSLFAAKETVSSIIPAFSSGYLALPDCTFGLPHPESGFIGEDGAEGSLVSPGRRGMPPRCSPPAKRGRTIMRQRPRVLSLHREPAVPGDGDARPQPYHRVVSRMKRCARFFENAIRERPSAKDPPGSSSGRLRWARAGPNRNGQPNPGLPTGYRLNPARVACPNPKSRWVVRAKEHGQDEGGVATAAASVWLLPLARAR